MMQSIFAHANVFLIYECDFLRKLQTNKNTIRNRVNRAGMSLSMLIHRYRYVVVLGRFNNLAFSYIYIYELSFL